MSYNFILTSDGEELHFETEHYINDCVRQVFEDLMGPYNCIHWTDADIEWFLETKGKLANYSFSLTLTENDDNAYIMCLPNNIILENIDKIIICLYGTYLPSDNVYGNILENIINIIPVKKETEILVGWIEDKTINDNSINVSLITICSDVLV